MLIFIVAVKFHSNKSALLPDLSRSLSPFLGLCGDVWKEDKISEKVEISFDRSFSNICRIHITQLTAIKILNKLQFGGLIQCVWFLLYFFVIRIIDCRAIAIAIAIAIVFMSLGEQFPLSG